MKAAAAALLAVVLAAWPAAAPRAQAPADTCAAHLPWGAPAAPGPVTRLCRPGYASAYDGARRGPLWVAERLTASGVWGCVARSGSLRVDRELPSEIRSSGLDYDGSGYDAGHMAADANHRADPAAAAAADLYSNVWPQAAALNAGLWARLETLGRVWATLRGEVIVLSGPVFAPRAAPAAIGRGVAVPSGFWKVFVDPATRQTLAFVVPHAPLGWAQDPAGFVASLEAVEGWTGLRLPRPEGWAVLAEPQARAPWPGDAAAARRMREAACGGPVAGFAMDDGR